MFRGQPSVSKDSMDRPTFVPALISAPAELPKPDPVTPSRVEIVLTGGRRIIVYTGIDPEVLEPPRLSRRLQLSRDRSPDEEYISL
ncbi:hypothetical protein FP2506_00515 [Fulvimarina pelagi HTCC2506]|uniref:Uncharacterized protein n=1 Tax=Fulvimarina pelagi HTCC2506 TaxID=314231 RepID=Q0FXD0_9HYPH|nr:hypothetical protein FP2506_00515 [Fulvimarina pelagi HTCC2506]